MLYLPCRCSIPRKHQRRIKRFHKFIDLDWLGEITKETRFQPLLDVAQHGIGAKGYDGDVFCCWVVAQYIHGFDAANAGQVDVHQNDIRSMGARQRHALVPVSRAKHAYI